MLDRCRSAGHRRPADRSAPGSQRREVLVDAPREEQDQVRPPAWGPGDAWYSGLGRSAIHQMDAWRARTTTRFRLDSNPIRRKAGSQLRIPMVSPWPTPWLTVAVIMVTQ